MITILQSILLAGIATAEKVASTGVPAVLQSISTIVGVSYLIVRDTKRPPGYGVPDRERDNRTATHVKALCREHDIVPLEPP